MGRLRKTWWDDVQGNMNSFGMIQEDAQVVYKWRKKSKEQLADQGSEGKG